MSKKILVAYASGSGSTAEVAEVIAEVLREAVAVETRHVDDVENLDGYSGVVVGSSIRAGRWLPEAQKMVEELAPALKERPVAYFSTCLTMVDDNADTRRIVLAYMDPILKIDPDIKPVGLGCFAGSLDPVRRLILPSGAGPQGDYRDWKAIRGWAARIRPALVAGPANRTPNVTEMIDAVLSLTDLSQEHVSEVVQSSANLKEADQTLTRVEQADLDWANFTESKLEATNLKGANLIGAVLQDADLREADLSEATLNGADLSGSNMVGANLERADLNWTDLSTTDLRRANLRGANLAYANLFGAKLEGADFSGARYNEHTRWPDDFSPVDVGAIHIDQHPS